MDVLTIVLLVTTILLGIGGALLVAPLITREVRDEKPPPPPPLADDAEPPADAEVDDEQDGEVEVLQVKVVSANDLLMRAEAMARILGKMNPYVVLTLGARHMRTRIALDNSSPRFGETFHVELDRSSDASQLLAMQVNLLDLINSI